jgi:hypothetical protein
MLKEEEMDYSYRLKKPDNLCSSLGASILWLSNTEAFPSTFCLPKGPPLQFLCVLPFV